MSRGTARRTIQIISHGPSCLDGVMAAAAVARFYQGNRVITRLPANNESDRTLQDLEIRTAGEDNEIWITDLSWNSTATGEHLAALAAKGARIHWIDHHRTAITRADAPEFAVPFSARVLSERYSAARLTFNYLRRRLSELAPAQARAYERFAPFAAIADDNDRWIHRIPESKDWAMAVQTLGGSASYREILRLDEPRMSRRLRSALEAGREAMAKSLELARSTTVDRMFAEGRKLRSACCFGYSSEVAAALYDDQTMTVVALFDLRSQGVSLRRSADCDVDLSVLARTFGGGGHAAAAGFALSDIKRAPAEKLSEILASRLSGA
jgi:oligoribonuclease NrnB/cAMP/cGMP phosphodiesterase (DHH superfamily)